MAPSTASGVTAPSGLASPESPPGELSACAGAEPFALMVLGNDMAPEFVNGDVVVIEPGGLARDGSFVLATWRGEYVLRRLRAAGGGWRLEALRAGAESMDVPDLACVRGVVIRNARRGRRRDAKNYL